MGFFFRQAGYWLCFCCLHLFLLIQAGALSAKNLQYEALTERQNCQYQFDNTLGEIKGRVRGDLIGLGGVKVVLLQKEKVVDEAFTDEDGYYSFTYVNPGSYEIRGSKNGYRTSIAYDVPVNAAKMTTANFYLPKFNNLNMNRYPIVESYTELMR